MRVFTFISDKGSIWSLAQRIKEEGNRAIVYINNPKYRSVGNGIIEKHPDQGILINNGVIDERVLLEVLYPNPDCIVIEGFGFLADRLRKAGYPVIGSCSWGDKIEQDKIYGHKVMKMTSIPHLATEPRGIRLSTELWFNGDKVVCFNCAFVEKELLEGNRGPQAECMGSILWISSDKSELFKEGIGMLVPALKKVNYRGPLTFNVVITEQGLVGMDFVARFNLSTIFVIAEMYKGKLNDLFYSVASGVEQHMEFKSEWGIGTTICVPPYPLNVVPDYSANQVINGISQDNIKHMWLYDVYKSNERYLCGGCGGMVGVVTARGDKIGEWSPLREAKRRVLRTISNLITPNLMYRRDIGDGVPAEYRRLQEWGWL